MEKNEKTVAEHVQDINKKFEEFHTMLAGTAKAEDYKGLSTELSEIKGQLAGKDGAEGIVKQLENLTSAVDAQGLQIKKMETEGPRKVLTLPEILAEKREELGKLRKRETSAVKATVQTSDITSNTNASRVPGAGRMQDRLPFLRELFNQSGVGANSNSVIRYTDQTTNTNSAAAFEEAAAVPSSSDIAWTEYSLDIENVGDSIKIAQRMIDNIDFVAGEVQNFLTKNIALKVDSYLYSGTGSNQPYGVTARATAYAAGSYANSYADANLMDLIRVCKSLISTGTAFMPNYAILNPVDAEKYLYGKKDANNNYIIPQNGSLISLIGGLTIVVNSGVTVNTMVVGDFTYGVVYDQKALNLEFGYVDDDFQKNLVTLKGYEELNLLIRGIHQGAFRSVTDIATAVSGLDAVVA